MSRIAVRGYTKKVKPTMKSNWSKRPDPPLTHGRVLVFDTETTTDQYQNLTFGSFKIFQNGHIQHEGLFYDPSKLNESEIKKVKFYVKKRKNFTLYTSKEFIDDVFYPELYGLHTPCVGFNLAFDISRIAYRAANSRKNNRGGFTFFLSKNPSNPPITIKQIGNVNTFRFSTTMKNKGNNYFSGFFLDAQTLSDVLLQKKHLSLEKVGQLLNLSIKKKKVSEHGKITQSYIDYNIGDVETTYDAYKRLVEELRLYEIDIPSTRVFSSASIGKYALKQLGIKPLSECQPDFPSDILGNLLTAYYGGRTECKIRKVPIKVSVLDFTSMYPTITMLLRIWNYGSVENLI